MSIVLIRADAPRGALAGISNWLNRAIAALDDLIDSRESFRHELHAMNGVRDPDAAKSRV